ncbi:MAG: TlpA disulfide reductase family protein [Nonlabens sp.]|uniref:TlpA family protein disulfide reductase n=1 Tax=Nonlabens sp. TaxID=1888209 RepID=UPI0035A5FD56
MHISKAIFLFLLLCNGVIAQQHWDIEGHFPEATNQEILLKGFTIDGDSLLSQTTTDDKGSFYLQYPATYVGAAVLEIKSDKNVVLLLKDESFTMQWDSLEDFSTLKFTGSPENEAFAQGMSLYQQAEGKRAGLHYLLPLYEQDTKAQRFLQQQMDSQNGAMDDFLGSLPKDLYARYYLSIRKLMADMPQTARRYTARMPAHTEQFNNIDFSDKRLLHSGLYTELLDTYYVTMESFMNSQYEGLNASTDAILESVSDSPELQQQVAKHLFQFFEKRSLFPAAKHLALGMLDDESCILDVKVEALFEQYRKMAIGKTAAELVLVNSKTPNKKFTDIDSKYKLIVFGASWCPKCTEEIPKIKEFYQHWQEDYDLEVVLISLDTDPIKYAEFIHDFPWVSSCDLQSWKGENVKNYYVSGTPTMYLLDRDQKILHKPVSAAHVEAWLKSQKQQEKKAQP